VLPGQSELSSVESNRRAYYRSVAQIGVQTASALSYAHARGIVHRDIKPGNLLLDTTGNVWVTDFGLAKTGDAGMTHTGDILGTIRYMSPERFRGQCDVRADVYALGMTLYELLTLKAAYVSGDRLKLMELIRSSEPASPRSIDARIPRDLETIVMKAIDKDMRRRYQSVDEMWEDLQRFVNDEPIKARRVSQAERLWRWCRRNPAVASLMALVALLLVCSAVGTGLWAVSADNAAQREKTAADREREAAAQSEHSAELAKQQADRATREADRSRHLLYVSDLNLAQQAWVTGDTGGALALLDRQVPHDGQDDLRGFEWRYLWRLCQDGSRQTLPGHTRIPGRVRLTAGIAFSPDGQSLATSGGNGGEVRLWDVATQRHVRIVGGGVGCVAFAADGKTLAFLNGGAVWLWDVAARCERDILQVPKPRSNPWAVSLALSSANLLAVGCSDGTIHTWDLATRQAVGSPLEGHTDSIPQVAFTPDGRTLAFAGPNAKVHLWDVAARRLITALEGHSAYVHSLAFSPDGKLLASASNDATIRLWDTAAQRQVKRLWGQRTALTSVTNSRPLQSLAFSPNSATLATGGADGTIRLWDVKTMEAAVLLRGHTAAVRAVAFAPDGRSLVSGSEDGTIKVWDVAPGPDPDTLKGHKSNLSSLAFSDDGKILAVADSLDQTVKLWDLASRQVTDLKGHTAQLGRLAFAPGGRTLACTDHGGTVRLWDVVGKKQIGEFRSSPAGMPLGSPAVPLGSTAFSPDGRLLAAGCLGFYTVNVWDLTTGQRVADLQPGYGYRAQFSPDGTLLATSSTTTVQLWDVATWQNVGFLSGHTAEVLSFAFARDGRTLAVGTADGTLCVWDLAQKRQVASRRGHMSNIEFVAFSPDGRRLATCGADGTARIWDVALLQEVAVLTGHDGPVNCLAFSPDGNTLATASADATVRLWHAPPLAAAPHEPVVAPSAPPVETIRLFTNWSGGMRLAREGNAQRIDVTGNAEIRLRLDELQEGVAYIIRFRAKADARRQIQLVGELAEPDYHNIGLSEDVSLTENWQPYQYTFQARNLAAVSWISLKLGQQTGTVWIADFTLTKAPK
jgi:WD40 repeat protein